MSHHWLSEPRNPHTGEWIDAGVSWLWGDTEERVGIDPPSDVVEAGVERGTQAAAAARSYTTGGYRDLNHRLVAGDDLTPAQEAIRGSLEGTMNDIPSRPVVFRGVRFDPGGPSAFLSDEERFQDVADAIERRFPVGSEVQMDGLQSTSFDVNPALDASLGRHSPGIMFEVRARRGVYLGKVSEFDDEDELLLPSGDRYRVLKILREVEFARDVDTVARRTVVQLEQL